MHVWRICRQRHVADALSGIGAAKAGGRWNFKGEQVVYASTSLSLASLELFVHLEPEILPDDLYAVEAQLPDDSLETVAAADLPKNWRDYPAPTALQELGSVWLREVRTLSLVVPSSVNPDENNVLVNPAHPEFKRVQIKRSKPFQFDPRMWKRPK